MTTNERSSVDHAIRSAVAGGFAGGVAKTAVAPLDRLKILYQTHHHEFKQFPESWRGGIRALKYIVQTQGFSGLYRGHSLTLARAIPHAAIGYTLYEYARKLIMPTKESVTSTRRFLAGSAAGVSVLPFTYPFELVRVRMAIESRNSSTPRPSLVSVFRTIYREPSSAAAIWPLSTGFSHFYRGFLVSLLGTVPYRGGIFLVWETLNAQAQRRISDDFQKQYQKRIHLVIGATAGTTSQIATYPLEVIRRMQQASGGLAAMAGAGTSSAGSQAAKAGDKSFLGFLETVRKVYSTSGLRGFYAGLGIGLVKQVPMHSISLTVWQAAKQVLDV